MSNIWIAKLRKMRDDWCKRLEGGRREGEVICDFTIYDFTIYDLGLIESGIKNQESRLWIWNKNMECSFL